MTAEKRLFQIGAPCPTCGSGFIGQSQYNFRCANCGWLGPRIDTNTPERGGPSCELADDGRKETGETGSDRPATPVSLSSKTSVAKQLAEYVVHRYDCRLGKLIPGGTYEPCNCGLRALLDQLPAVETECQHTFAPHYGAPIIACVECGYAPPIKLPLKANESCSNPHPAGGEFCALPKGHLGDHAYALKTTEPLLAGMTSEAQSREHERRATREALLADIDHVIDGLAANVTSENDERCGLCGGTWRAPNNCMNAFHRWAGAEDPRTANTSNSYNIPGPYAACVVCQCAPCTCTGLVEAK